MSKFFINAVFRIGNEMVLSGKVEEGNLSNGMHLNNAPPQISILCVEKNNKKLSSASQGEIVGMRIPYYKLIEGITNQLVEFL